VTVPLLEISETGFAGAVAAFHDEHLRQYRYSHPDAPVETSTLRVAARGHREKPDLRSLRYGEYAQREIAPDHERDVHFEEAGWVRTRVVDRGGLEHGDEFAGPCVVEEVDSTLILPPGTSARVDGVGNIVIALA
jgi:N-methylhydantoinase A